MSVHLYLSLSTLALYTCSPNHHLFTQPPLVHPTTTCSPNHHKHGESFANGATGAKGNMSTQLQFCIPCPAGKWQSEERSASCLPCTARQVSENRQAEIT
jgi:hypothetical protein